MMSLVRPLLVIAILLAAPVAQAASVREVMEKYGLIGTFALDCTQEVSKKNSYYVRRPLDDNHVQHDLMHGPTTSVLTAIIDSATPRGPNQVAYSQTNLPKTIRNDTVVLAEGKRWRVLEMLENGKTIATGGRFTFGERAESAWVNKCS